MNGFILLDDRALGLGGLGPGWYAARSDSEIYRVIEQLIFSGKAQVVGSMPSGGTLQMLGIELRSGARWGARANPSAELNQFVRLPPDAFSATPSTYGFNWGMCWWRELIQNAVDAGATKITASMTEESLPDFASDGPTNPEMFVRLTFTDDGKGMNATELLRHFLSVGASGKGRKEGKIENIDCDEKLPEHLAHSEGVGGFGEAKKLLLFAWPAWAILTTGSENWTVRVRGAGPTHSEPEMEDTLPRGTLVRVWMPKDNHATLSDLEKVLKRSNLPNVAVKVGDSAFQNWLTEGKRIRSMQKVGFRKCAKFFKVDTPQENVSDKIFIRVNGVWMFDRYLKEGAGQYILELDPSLSRHALTANRQSLNPGTDISQRFEDIVAAFAVEKKSMIREDRYEQLVYTNASTQVSHRRTAVIMQHLPSLEDLSKKKTPAKFTKDVAKGVVKALASSQEGVLGEPVIDSIVGYLPAVRVYGEQDRRNVAASLGWTFPVMMVDMVSHRRKMPAIVRPDSLSLPAAKLLTVWAEIVRGILVLTKSRLQLGVGFVFSNDALALHTQEGGMSFLLINPVISIPKGEMYASIRDFPGKDPVVATSTDRELMQKMFASAQHEFVHAEGISEHDTTFAAYQGRLLAQCAPLWQSIMRTATLSRKAAVGRQAFRPAATTDVPDVFDDVPDVDNDDPRRTWPKNLLQVWETLDRSVEYPLQSPRDMKGLMAYSAGVIVEVHMELNESIATLRTAGISGSTDVDTIDTIRRSYQKVCSIIGYNKGAVKKVTRTFCTLFIKTMAEGNGILAFPSGSYIVLTRDMGLEAYPFNYYDAYRMWQLEIPWGYAIYAGCETGKAHVRIRAETLLRKMRNVFTSLNNNSSKSIVEMTAESVVSPKPILELNSEKPRFDFISPSSGLLYMGMPIGSLPVASFEPNLLEMNFEIPTGHVSASEFDLCMLAWFVCCAAEKKWLWSTLTNSVEMKLDVVYDDNRLRRTVEMSIEEFAFRVDSPWD